METNPSNPFYIFLFFVLRCLLPLGIMLGISIILKKLGLISDTPKPPPDEDSNHNENNNGEGGFAHA